MTEHVKARYTRERASKPVKVELISVNDAALRLDVSAHTVRRWITSGMLPAYRVGRRLIKVDLADLDRVAKRIPTAGDAA
jgi:excisionase family DNA binding protein